MYISFLTRTGCANSPLLQGRLIEAIKTLGLDATLAVIDRTTLPAADHRTGYGTPTVLVDDEDLFGHPKPLPAAPA